MYCTSMMIFSLQIYPPWWARHSWPAWRDKGTPLPDPGCRQPSLYSDQSPPMSSSHWQHSCAPQIYKIEDNIFKKMMTICQTYLDPSAEPKYHMASTFWCSAKYFVMWSRDPERMLTTPPGRSLVSNIYNKMLVKDGHVTFRWPPDLIHVKSQYWIFFTRDDDHGVGSCDGRSEQRHETEKRTGVRTWDSNDSNRFMNLDHGSCKRINYS